MRVNLDSIKIVDIRRIFLSRVDTIVRRTQRGQPLCTIIINSNGELIEGEHELYAARRMGLIDVDVLVRGNP